MWSRLVGWWRDRGAGSSAGGAAAHGSREDEAPKAQAAARRRRSTPTPDDLTVIHSIGPVMRDRLRILGIATFAELAAADAADLAMRLRWHQPISDTQVRQWIEAAKRRTDGTGI